MTTVVFDRPSTDDVTLVIEASTSLGSLAVVRFGRCVGSNTVAMGASRDDGLFPAIQALLVECALEPSDLTRVVCGAGPGSFTSLRIAAALAKGLVHGTGAMLAGVSSLLLSAASAVERMPSDVTEMVVHSDALRGERYAQRVHIDAARMVRPDGPVDRVACDDLEAYCRGAARVAVTSSPVQEREAAVVLPAAGAIVGVASWEELAAASLGAWEPVYGRLAEAQVVWERTHGHALPAV
ncbi:MAG TPA: tRNA (adenosine(37)-N6)-threonylcarbamoyltransferase complex dimerization subunit type 1 TsaB [Gemmatimonas sp.]|nr:tRNA (adenosine(37)-N6)-threonylcarbamoyltransferase complex dimerization subunit type 1 TsaB [Gemmatimonas sp.]